jgi:hypothetical protein
MVKIRLNFVAVSAFFKVSLHVVLIRDNQNDKLKKENPDFRFYSLYPHVPLQEWVIMTRVRYTLGCIMFAQGKKQLETRAIIKISTQPC